VTTKPEDKIQLFKPVKTLADLSYDSTPECFHCDAELPRESKAERQGDAIVVWCPNCGNMTPFPIG